VKLGLENKRNVVLLSVLGLGALYGVYSNFTDSSAPSSSSSTPAATAEQPPTIGSRSGDSDQPPPPRARARNEEWHPVVHPKNKDEQVNPATIDPTLRLDLLAKVLTVKPAGGARNLFEFGPAKPVETAALNGAEPRITGPKPMGPSMLPPPPPPPGPPPERPDPPVGAQYYGFASPSNSKRLRGFFMEKVGENENVLIKAEGEILVGRYKIVKLESGSVTVQNLDSKRTQTLKMADDASD
jgi:hypothetical protein